jgi:hypothetical protein
VEVELDVQENALDPDEKPYSHSQGEDLEADSEEAPAFQRGLRQNTAAEPRRTQPKGSANRNPFVTEEVAPASRIAPTSFRPRIVAKRPYQEGKSHKERPRKRAKQTAPQSIAANEESDESSLFVAQDPGHSNQVVEEVGAEDVEDTLDESFFVEALATTVAQGFTAIHCRHVSEMWRMMSRAEWSTQKEAWQRNLADIRVGAASQTGPRSEEASDLFRRVFQFHAFCRKAPKPQRMSTGFGYDFTRQNEHLRNKSGQLRQVYGLIRDQIKVVCDELADRPSSGRVAEVVLYIIPVLVLALDSAFLLGGGAVTYYQDEQSRSKVGSVYFTSVTLDILARMSGHLANVYSRLAPLLEREVANSDRSGDDINMTVSQRQAAVKKKKTARERLQLGRQIEAFRGQVHDAQAALKKQGADAERLVEQKRQRDRAEREEEELQKRQWRSFCSSTRAIREKEDPLDIRRKFLRDAYVPKPTQPVASVESDEPDEAEDEYAFEYEAEAEAENDYEADDPQSSFSAEESDILLRYIRSDPNVDLAQVAEDVLDKEYEEVVRHAEDLKRGMRRLVHAQGLQVPRWAKAARHV